MWKPLAAVMLFACTPDPDPDDVSDTDTDTDADSDADTDADADTDTDLPVVDADGDGAPADLDCDDADPDVFPGAPDLCGDERVTDCDRTSDDGLVTLDGLHSYDDLALALAAATPGADVLVCPGTYTGSFVATVPIGLRSLAGPELTVLDGGDAGRTLEIPAGTTVDGFLVRGGNVVGSGGGILVSTPGMVSILGSTIRSNTASTGGGIAIGPDVELTLVDVAVEQNHANGSGGGISAQARSTVDLGESTVSRNTASDEGGGVLLASATLVGGTVGENEVTGSQFEGGGGIVTTGDSAVTGTVVTANLAPNGAGMRIAGGTTTLTDVLVEGNTAQVDGGGLEVALGATVVLGGSSEVRGNEATWNSGGGLVSRGTVIGGQIRGNHASNHGGGIAAWAGSLTDVVIVDNEAGYSGGGASVTSVEIRGCEIRTNQAPNAGGLYLGDAEIGVPNTVVDTVVADNAADTGGGVLAYPGTTFVLENVEVSGNVATFLGGGLHVGGSGTVTGGSIVRNGAGDVGGGVYLATDGVLSLAAVELGSDGDDNTPDDVGFASTAPVFGYGTGVTMTCDDGGCAP